MIEKISKVDRKKVEEDRIAICPKFGCKHLEKIKPLKFGVFGFRKYPICPKHKLALVFVDEFIENFIQAVDACLFDISGLPPENIINLIKEKSPIDLNTFINGWMYCTSIGRGAQIVSNYMDGLSRSYIKLLNRKQKKSLRDEVNSKKHYLMLRLGLQKIAEEYAAFLQNLREKSEIFSDHRGSIPFSSKANGLIQTWLKSYLNQLRFSKERCEFSLQNKSLPMLKRNYDEILHAGTCSLLLGKSPTLVTRGISAFELFSAYHSFLKAGLCSELEKNDVDIIIEEIVKETNEPHENNILKISKITDFNEEYREKLLEFIDTIYKQIEISDKISLNRFKSNVERLFRDACDNGLTRKIVHNQDLRYSEKLAIVFAYYSLLLSDIDHIGEIYLKPALIYNKVRDSLIKRGISSKAKRPTILSGFLYDYLHSDDQEKLFRIPFFKARAKKYIPFKANTKKELEELIKCHKNPKNLKKIVNLILEDLFSNNFRRINIPSSCRNPKNLSHVVLFLALQHSEYKVRDYYPKFKNFLNFIPLNTDLSNVCFYEIVRIVYQFLSLNFTMKITYLPQDLGLVDLTVLQKHFLRNISQITHSLDLKAPEVLEAIALDLYQNALRRGFSFNDLPSNNIPSLALAFVFLSIQLSEDHTNLSRRLMMNNLNKADYSFSEHTLGPILQYINKFIKEDVDFKFKAKISSDYFQNELIKISLNHESFGRDHVSTFVDLILELYKSSDLEPPEFARSLGIYSNDPSQILSRVGKDGALTRVDIFIEMEKNIKNFIKMCIPEKDSKDLQLQLVKVIEYFHSSKKIVKYQSYQKVKKRRALYGDNYKSTIVRLKRFIELLGFSPFDGYDFMENKYLDVYNKTRLNAQFHHLDYKSNNDTEENLVFLPSKHPKDSKKKIRYMTHDKISGLEATFKDERTNINIKKKAQMKLREIEKRLKINAKIVTQAFFTKNKEVFDGLIGWSQQSIMKIKIRLEDSSLSWTSSLNNYIPREKYGKKVSNLEFNNLKKKIVENY